MPIDPGGNGVIDERDDLGIEPNTGRPLMDFDAGKSLPADYTSYITRDNDFPVAPGVHEAASSNRGSSLPAAETEGAIRVFADSRDAENANSLLRSNSQIFDAAGYPLGDLVDKTGDGSAQSGNQLLSEVIGASSNSDIIPNQSDVIQATFSSLKKYNRFSPSSDPASFAADENEITITTGNYSDTRNLRFQKGEGEFSKEVTEISAEVSQDTLIRVARSMILKSAGWDASIDPLDAENPDQNYNTTIADLTNFPEIVRETSQQVVEPFRAQDAYGMPQNPDGSSFLSGRGDAIQRSIDEANYSRTRGSTHTPDHPFGENPANTAETRVQSLQAAIAIVGLASFIEARLVNVSAYISELQVSTDSVLRGPYYMGSSRKSRVTTKTRALIRSFMFQTGIYSYDACVSEGLYACFGFDELSISPNVRQTIGLNTNTLATIYRSQIEKINNNLGKEYWDSSMGLSQGFWRAVAESAFRTISTIRDSTVSVNGADFVTCLMNMKDSLAVKMINIFAAIGYQRLVIQGVKTSSVESGGEEAKNPYDMNSYPVAPGTRQMKSRDGALLSNASLAWRNSALPSMFILPVESMANSLDMDYLLDANRGSNPIKGMLGSTLYDKTFVKGFRNSNNIPSLVSKLLEDRLGAEYVPFYFKDLRTNEIVAFHAFLESLTDGFTASYNSTKGFGRSDSVQNYVGTERGMGLTFWIVSTSKEDFDEMWFKINKLTTFVYPQYTRGRKVVADDNSILGSLLGREIKFEQPFSQLAGGTPVIRMRVGDLIKSNYSRSNFSKLFGVGNDTFGLQDKITIGGTDSLLSQIDLRLALFLIYAGSPMELLQFSSALGNGGAAGAGRAAIDAAAELSAYFLKNGFVNPILNNDREVIFKNIASRETEALSAALTFLGLRSKTILKARSTPYTVTDSTGNLRLLRLRRPVFVKVGNATSERTGPVYSVTLDDSTVGEELNGSEFKVSAADLYVDSGQIVDATSMPGLLLAIGYLLGGGAIAALAGAAAGALSNIAPGDAPLDVPLVDLFGSTGRTFTSPYNNPITRAFEDRMGEGLAGVIKSMSFTWMEAPWEIDWNSRAPMACKVTVSFAPIHDISPGLDSNGFNRAPIYNVGQTMHDTFGNTRADGGNASRYFYRKGGATAENADEPLVK
jgi:hypothetical protein